MAARPSSLVAVIERGFTEGVAERIARGPCTYTDRTALLAAGQKLGIDRVRANAIIADQQQRVAKPTGSPGLLATVVTFAVVQGAVIAAFAWVWKA